MKLRKNIYAVTYILVVSGLCALAVTAARHAWWPLIEQARRIDRDRAILELFEIPLPAGAGPEVVDRIFERHVVIRGVDQMQIFEVRDRHEQKLGEAFEFVGQGYNGPIYGVMAVRPDGRTIRGVRFYRHSETPTRGGKITEESFLSRFRGKALTGSGGEPGFTVTMEGGGERSIDAISEATQTTRSVVGALNRGIAQYLAGGQRLEPVDIELPPAVGAVAAPPDVPDLLEPSAKPREPLLAPPGATNLAAGRPVTSGDEMPVIGELSQITDGDRQPGMGHFVELFDGLQWVQIDLGRPCEIHGILFWHEYRPPVVYYDVIVQFADDEDFMKNVRTLFNNDRDNSAGLGPGDDLHYVESHRGKLVRTGGQRARYVRLYSNNNHSQPVNRYIEVEVYGVEAD
jgi:Na+-transporting NADH:ubiquinone oxidoreductase subunit NqrC